MNWNIILSKYPRSILDDDKALLLLALLERNGLATEDELYSSIKLEKHLLKKVLIDLQLNQFIQYGSNYVRLTEKGKNIIDRFGLLEPIVSDFVDSLGYEGKEKKDFEQVLSKYRSSSFEFYQNSLCTIRTWKSLAEEIPSKTGSTHFLDELIGGMRSLLLRDLRNWWLHSNQPDSIFQDVNKDLQFLICSTNLEKTRIPKTWDSKKIYAVVFLNKLENANIQIVDFPDSAKHQYEIEPLISAFHIFQYNSAPFEWYDDLSTVLPQIPGKRKIEDQAVLLTAFNTLLGQSKRERKLLNSDKAVSIKIYRDWIPTKKETLWSNDILETLMIASDIKELSQRTGIQETSLRNLIIDIRSKCENLLGIQPKADPSR